MCPASGKNDIRIFPVQLPVSGIAVTDNYPCKAPQEFPRVVCFSGPLIFIQDDGRIFVDLPGAVDPHIALAVCGAPILRYHDRSFIGLQHMVTIQFFMEIIIKDSQIPVRTLDHPVRHHLLGNVDVVPQEFLTDPVQRKPIYILGIHDTCRQRRSQDAVPQQIFRTVCLNDRLIVPAGIDSYMMLFNCIHGWLNTDSFVDFIRKLFPAIRTEEFLQFFVRKRMRDHFNWKIL